MYAIQIINLFKYAYENKFFINDMSSVNIGYTDKYIICIDYEIDTISTNFNFTNSYLPKYLLTDDNQFKYIDKLRFNQINYDIMEVNNIYILYIVEILYHIYFTHISSVNMTELYFINLFCDRYYTKYDNNKKFYYYTINKSDDELDKIITELSDQILLDGVKNLFFIKNDKSLMSTKYDNILSYDEIIKKINMIKLKEIPNYKLNSTVITKLQQYDTNDTKIKLDIYGFRQIDENPNYNQFQIFAGKKDIKILITKYYLLYNRWSIITYKNDTDSRITDNTLKYALQTVGCIHSVEFDENGPIFKIHLNEDYLNRHGSYYDNCRSMELNIITLIWWIINITDMFNIVFLKYNKIKFNKIYINIVDHPIDRIDKKHPFVQFRNDPSLIKIKTTVETDPKYPIFCWPAKKGYKDIGLPFHDMWMFVFEREFSTNFNISSYINIKNKKYTDKLSKAIFRGSFTNCINDDMKLSNTVRIKAHIKALQDNYNILDSAIVGVLNTYQDYHDGYYDHLNIDNLGNAYRNKLFKTQDEQIGYKCILNLDGFASAFRIIQEMYYDSCIIIPDSDFTDVLRDVLVPWVHYVPCKSDLSNLLETIKWCINPDNVSNIEIILNNLKTLRDEIISIDSFVDFTFNKIIGNYNIKLSDNIVSLKNQPQVNIPFIGSDNLKTLGKKGTLLIKNKSGDIVSQEDIFYKKYLKYKQKYLEYKDKINRSN